jgi:hypothetical protein
VCVCVCVCLSVCLCLLVCVYHLARELGAFGIGEQRVRLQSTSAHTSSHLSAREERVVMLMRWEHEVDLDLYVINADDRDNQIYYDNRHEYSGEPRRTAMIGGSGRLVNATKTLKLKALTVSG